MVDFEAEKMKKEFPSGRTSFDVEQKSIDVHQSYLCLSMHFLNDFFVLIRRESSEEKENNLQLLVVFSLSFVIRSDLFLLLELTGKCCLGEHSPSSVPNDSISEHLPLVFIWNALDETAKRKRHGYSSLQTIILGAFVVTFSQIRGLHSRWLVNEVREQSLVFAEDRNANDDDQTSHCNINRDEFSFPRQPSSYAEQRSRYVSDARRASQLVSSCF